MYVVIHIVAYKQELACTHLGLEDAVDEMNRMQQLESARKEQEALSGKTDEVRLSKKHFRAG